MSESATRSATPRPRQAKASLRSGNTSSGLGRSVAGVAAARLDLPQRAVELEGDGVARRERHDVRAASGAARLALRRSLASRHRRQPMRPRLPLHHSARLERPAQLDLLFCSSGAIAMLDSSAHRPPPSSIAEWIRQSNDVFVLKKTEHGPHLNPNRSA